MKTITEAEAKKVDQTEETDKIKREKVAQVGLTEGGARRRTQAGKDPGQAPTTTTKGRPQGPLHPTFAGYPIYPRPRHTQGPC